MDRGKLNRQLRRVAKLGRYVRERQGALRNLMLKLQVTDAELEVLCTVANGYLVVGDAREKNKHITLSDADELAQEQARRREQARAESAKKIRDARLVQLKKEQEERKNIKVTKKKQQALEMLKAMVAAGVNPETLLKGK